MKKLQYYFVNNKILTIPALMLLWIALLGPFSITSDLGLPSINHTPYNEPELAAFNIYNWDVKDKKAETLCLAKNLYFEGRGESTTGQIAIGLVTINRVKSKSFPNSICKVVFEKRRHRTTRRMVAQFSWTLDGNSNQPRMKTKAWHRVYAVAKAMTADGVLSNFYDFTKGSMFYHATYMDPHWFNLTPVKVIDSHLFYRA